MKSFHPVTKALGGSRLLLECDFFFFKGGQQQKNSSLNQNTQPLQFFSQPLFLFAFPNTILSGLVCKGVLDLRLRLFCKESPKTSQFSSIHIYSASGTMLSSRGPEVGGTLHCCWRQCNLWGDSHKTQTFLICSSRANTEEIPGTWGSEEGTSIQPFR